MDDSDQQVGDSVLSHRQSVGRTAQTAINNSRIREVKARYLQPKPTPAARHGQVSSSRPGTAAYQSAGWVELQLPNHASTPLMMNTGCQSAVFTQTSKARRPQHTPAPATAQRSLQQTALTQRRQQQLSKGSVSSSALQQQQQPRAAPAGGAPHIGQRQHHDIAPLSDTGRRTSITGPPAALVSPGSSRSSTSCSARHSEVLEPDLQALHMRQPGLTAAEQQTPQVSRLAMSMVVMPGSAAHPARLGMSAAVGSAVRGSRTVDKAAAARKAQLEEFRKQKEQKQQGLKAAASGRPTGFKEPAPKTMFKATAQASQAGVAKPPLSARCAATSATFSAAGSGRSTASAAAAEGPSSASAQASAVAAATPAASPPSAFKATMATLQQTGSGSKGGRPSSVGKQQAGRISRPSGVPTLPMDWLHKDGAATPRHTPQQTARRFSLPMSATKIPTLDFSGLAAQQQLAGPSVPLSSRQVSSAALVPLPDATPRTFRDAPPSRLPKTPREPCVANEYASVKAAAIAVSQKQDATMGSAGSAAALVGSGGMSSRQRTKAQTNSKTPRHTGTTGLSSTSCARAASTLSRNAAASAQALSSRGAGSSAAAAAAATTGVVAEQPPQGVKSQHPLKTPRWSMDAGAGAEASCTPRSLASSTVSGAGPSNAAAAAAAKRSDQERADEVRQQLRLLRMQNLQLRHLSARVEAAVQAKYEKAESAAAAAAAAVINLSSELLTLKGQLAQQKWHTAVGNLLRRQLPKLKQWAQLQAQHRSNASQLHTACKAALSHVPLLNGACVGHRTDAPDLELLQRQLVHGMQLLQEVQPALQQLLGPDLPLISNSRDNIAAISQHAEERQSRSPRQQPSVLQNSVKTTAALAEQLMGVAAEECSLLGQLAQQLTQLSDLHLYANSMQVQLVQMKEAAEVQAGGGMAQPSRPAVN